MASSDNTSYTAYQGKDEKTGKTVTFVVHTDKFEKENEELIANGKEPIQGMTQSFSIPSADSVEDITILVPSPVGQVNAFNSGYSVQAANSARRLMRTVFDQPDPATNYEPFVIQQGHFDLQAKIAEDLANISKRLTPMEKAVKAMSDFSPEQIQAVFQQLLAASKQAA